MISKKERESPLQPPITLGTRNVDDPCDSQLLKKCDNSQAELKVKFGCANGSAHNSTTYNRQNLNPKLETTCILF